MPERSFVQRNKRIYLRELTDVVALHEASGSKETRRDNHFISAAVPTVPSSQVRAFEQAGWVFQEPSSGGPRAGVREAKVFIRQDGRLALSTNLLTRFGCAAIPRTSRQRRRCCPMAAAW